jgi:hypothetical protein
LAFPPLFKRQTQINGKTAAILKKAWTSTRNSMEGAVKKKKYCLGAVKANLFLKWLTGSDTPIYQHYSIRLNRA